MAHSLRAGVSRVALEPPLGCPMMGYGARQGTASGQRGPLFVRALFLQGSGALLIVELDVCLMSVSQAREVRERIAAETPLGVEQILVACTHTHSGPDTGLGQLLAGQPAPDHVAPLLDAAVEAGIAAVHQAEPARLAVGLAAVAIGRNRRSEDGRADPVARVLRVDREGGSVLCIAHWHGCHPTVLGHDNLSYSADWPGAAAEEIEARFPGAIALFGLAAHADIDPRTRGLLDLAIPLQSVGVGFEEMETLGREYAGAVVEQATQLKPVDDPCVGARSGSVVLDTHASGEGEEGRRKHLTELRRRALVALDLPPDSDARTQDLYRLENERTAGLPADEVRARLSCVREYLRDRSARLFAGGDRVEVEAQVLRIGPMWLLAIPAECCVDVGQDWSARVGGEASTVASIANGWLRYLPAARHFDESRAREKYEILQSTFTAGAADQLIETGLRIAGELRREVGAE